MPSSKHSPITIDETCVALHIAESRKSSGRSCKMLSLMLEYGVASSLVLRRGSLFPHQAGRLSRSSESGSHGCCITSCMVMNNLE